MPPPMISSTRRAGAGRIGAGRRAVAARGGCGGGRRRLPAGSAAARWRVRGGGAAQDGARLVLHRAAVPRGAQAQPLLEVVVELADGQAGHEQRPFRAILADDCIAINAIK